MEEGYYWVTRPEGATVIAHYYAGLWWFHGSERGHKGERLVVGPRVKGQEECQSDD